MMHSGSLSLGRKIALLFCAAFACVAIIFGALLPTVYERVLAVESPSETEISQTPTANPLKEYISVSISSPVGLSIYAGKTTAGALKRNITVTGTYTTSQGASSVKLEASEYIILMDGEPVADTEILDSGDSDVLIATIEVECGKLSALLGEIEIVKTAPDYKSLSVSLPNGITSVEDDHTADTMKDLLIVKGISGDGTETVIVNKELYEIDSLSLSEGNSNTVSVTYLPNTDCVGSIKNLNVIKAEVQRISVAAASDLVLVGEYYRKPSADFASGIAVFVEGMKSGDILPSLSVTAHYPNSVRPITMNDDWSEVTTEGIEACVVTNNETFSAGPQTVNVSVTDDSGVMHLGSFTVRFEEQTIAKLTAKYNGSTDLTSSSRLDKSQFTVVPTYNNNVTSDDSSFSDYVIDGDLTPTAAQILDVLSKGEPENYTYSKSVWIRYTRDRNVCHEIKFDNIKYVPPAQGLGTIGGSIATQTVLEKFDFTGLYVELKYSLVNTVQAALTELKDLCTVEYLSKDETPVTTDVITKDIGYARIKFTYGDAYVISNYFPVNVEQATYDFPELDLSDIDYSENNCSKSIGNIDYILSKGNIKISVTDVAGKEVGATYSGNGNIVDEKSEDEAVGAVFNARTGAIGFTRGGTFTVKFTLTGGEDGDYRWEDCPQKTNYDLTYNVTVNRGALDVRLTYNGTEITTLDWEYGSPKKIDAVGKTVGSNVTVENMPSYKLYYYEEGGSSADRIEGLPHNVGSYRVIAVTDENDIAYKQSTTFARHALALTVKPKSVSENNVIQNLEYARVTYAAEDFVKLNSNDFFPNDLDVNKKPPVTISFISENTDSRHVGTCGVRLEITNTNYVWTKPTDSSKPRTIETTVKITQPNQSFSVVFVDEFEYATKNAELVKPSYKTVEPFYAAVAQEPLFYKLDANGEKTGEPLDFANCNQWPVGDYVVIFESSVNTPEDKIGDYEPPIADKIFKIVQRKIKLVTVAEGNVPGYDGNPHDFTLSDYNVEIMNCSVKGKTFGETEFTNEIVLNNGIVTVKYAGNYTAYISLKDTTNYVWAEEINGALVPTVADCTPTFSVNMQPIAYIYEQATEIPELKFPYVGGSGQAVPTFVIDTSINTSAVSDGLTLTYQTYDSVEFTAPKNPETDGVGDYYLKFVFDANVSDGFNLASNYVLPVMPEKFSIISAVLESIPMLKGSGDGDRYPVILEGTTLSGTYKGSAYNVTDYFVWTDGLSVDVKLDGLSVDLINAESYTIVVKPAPNYSWKEGLSFNGHILEEDSEIEFAFVISRLEVRLSWHDTVKIYGADKLQKPSVDILNKIGSDDLSVIVRIGESEDTANEPSVKLVGTYTAIAYQLDGTSKNNYIINPEVSDYSTEFTIRKQSVTRPVLVLDEVMFGTSDTVKFAESNNVDYWQRLASSELNVAAGVKGINWLGKTMPESDGIFNVADGTFIYVNAGIFTVTLTLGDTANYCWAPLNQSESYDIYSNYTETEFTVKVNRKTLVAPSIGNDRTMRWSGTTLTPSLTSDIDGSWYEVTYGEYENDNSYNADGSAQSVAVSRGEYFVRYSLTLEDKVNYVWIPNEKDHPEDLSGFVTKWEECRYTDTDVSVFIHYAVTNTILRVRFEFESYIFGSNLDNVTLGNTLKVINTNSNADMNDADELANEFDKNRVSLFTVTYFSSGIQIGKYTYSDGKSSYIGDLVNGLPWHADTYTVYITVKFKDEGGVSSNYQSFDIEDGSITLTVKQRVLEVNWFKPDGSALNENEVYEVMYDGEYHLLSAEIKNTFDKVGYGTEDFELTVSLKDGGMPCMVKGKGVEEVYVLYVTGISGINANDYAVKAADSNDYACFAQLKILRRAVKLSPVSSSHIYGDNPEAKGWQVAASSENGFAGNEETEAKNGNYIAVIISDSLGNSVTNLSSVNGNYIITLEAVGPEAFLNNYALDLTDVAVYDVIQRNITVYIDENEAVSIYGESVVLNTNSKIVTLSEDVTAFGETEPLFTLMAKDDVGNNISQISDAKKYRMQLENKNPNYNISFGEYYYEIQKAELSVEVNLSVYYGEKSPTSYDGSRVYRTALEDLISDGLLENGMYRVSGFANGDESKWRENGIGLSGSFDYSTVYDADSATNSHIGQYALVFNGSDLLSTNYRFVDGGGCLTVKQIDLTVKVKNATSVYNPQAVLSVEYDAEVPFSTYFPNTRLPEPSDYSSVFTLSTDAFASVGTNSVNLSGYDITCLVIDNNYTVNLLNEQGEPNPKYVITPAELNVKSDAVKGYSGSYDEKYHYVLLLGENSEVDVDDDLLFPDYVNGFAETVDGSRITVYFLLAYAQTDSIDWQNVSKSVKMPTVTDVGTYYIYFRIEAENHNPFDSKAVAVNIVKSDNAFVNKHLFANDSDIHVSDMDSAIGGFAALDKNAWTYGLYADNNAYGYNAEGGQKVSALETEFKKNLPETVFKLYYYRNLTDNVGMLLHTFDGKNSFTGIDAAISELLASGCFNAGYYLLEMSAEGTDNYNSTVGYRIFSIGKKSLSVIPNSRQVTYGEDAPEYSFDYSENDFVCSGKIENGTPKKDTEADLGLTSNTLPRFDAGYAAGDTAKITYIIQIQNKDDCVLQNYEFVFETAVLTVQKREVTIRIDDKENFFNLDNSYYISNGNGIKPEVAAALTFNVTVGSFYSSDRDYILLKTHAFDKCVESKLTNNAGKYPIYAVWTNNTGFDNYIIKFDCSEQGRELTLPDEENVIADAREGIVSCGTFTVKSARLSVNYTSPREVYDGKVREILPQLDEKYSSLVFETKYYKVDNNGNDVLLADGVLPIDVGTYKFEFIYKSSTNHENYISTASRVEFKITPATLTVSVNVTRIPYGTPLSELFAKGDVSRITYSIAGMSAAEVENALAFEIARGGVEYFDDSSLIFKSTYDFTKPAETVWTVTAEGIYAKNYAVSYLKIEDNLTVVQREVVFAVRGFNSSDKLGQGTYGDYHNDVLKKQFEADMGRFLTPITLGWNGSTSDGLSALGLTLSVNAEYYSDVDDIYVITAVRDVNVPKSNYVVRFTEDKAYYKINPAVVTFGVRVDAEITYGNEALFEYVYDGFKNGQTYESLLRLNDDTYVSGELKATTDYSAWSSHAGNVCSVTYGTESTLAFKNYTVNYTKNTFKVTSRKVDLGELASVYYTEDEEHGSINYHNGLYGAKHVPVLNFTGTGAASDSFVPKYDLSYYNTRTKETLLAARTADTYIVTVMLRANEISGGPHYDYVFVGSQNPTETTREFVVNKKTIGLSWNPSVIKFDDETSDKTASIRGIIADIMNIDEVYRVYNLNGSVVDTEIITEGEGEKQYVYNNSVLSLTAYNIGDYNAVISLKESALQNYLLTDGSNVESYVRLIFRAVSDTNWVDITVTLSGWEYGDGPNEPVLTIYNGDPENIRYTYTVQSLNKDYDKLPPSIKAGFTDENILINELELVGGNAAFTSKIAPKDVGVYVVRAYYPDTHQSAYYVFEITKAKITAPNAITGEYVYNGSRHSVSFEFDDATCLSVSHVGEFTTTPTVITVSATDAGKYTITFELRDIRNYEWADGTALTDGKVVLIWTIQKADDTVIDLNDIVSTYGSIISPNAHAESGSVIYYTYRAIEESEKDYTEADYKKLENTANWSAVQPSVFGKFWVRAESAGNGNYNATVKFARFVIDKATLTAVPYARVTYGEPFKPYGGTVDGYGYNLNGFVNGDTIYGDAVSGNVTYKLKESGLQNTVLDVDEYVLLLEVVDGEVAGLESDNYKIVAAEGVFSVIVKPINIKIDNLSSVYGDEIVLPDSAWSVVESGVDKTSLGVIIGLKDVSVSSKLDADNYVITLISYTNTNYRISFTTGIYTVNPRKIEISDMDLGLNTVGNVNGAQVKAMLDAADSQNKKPLSDTEFSAIRGLLYYEYSGTADGGIPQKAGSYYVTVGINSNNYRLVGQYSFLFEVLRREIDASKIQIENLSYTGTEFSERDLVIDYGVYDSSVCSIEFVGAVKDVGIYSVIFTLSDFENTKWQSVDTRERTFVFEVVQADNVLESFTIEGWIFGNYDRDKNAPDVATKFGVSDDYIFTYYADDNGKPQLNQPLLGVPTNAGTYWVSVFIPESRNYKSLTSEMPISFRVEKAVHVTPTLDIKHGVNDTYTGDNLQAAVIGFDSVTMDIYFDGISNISGGNVTVYAINAGTYTVKLGLKDSANYRWSDNAEVDSDGYALLTWKVARKKLIAPKADTGIYIVNGGILTYKPIGFDETTMNISGNTTSYGGKHQVVVSLKDPENYEWAEPEGSVSNFVFVWEVVGQETVFAVIVSVLSSLSVIVGGIALIQFLRHKKRVAAMAKAASVQENIQGGTEE